MRKSIWIYPWAVVANVLLYVYTAVLGTIALLIGPFDHSGFSHHRVARLWCRLIVWTIGTGITVHGVEKINSENCCVYMANHSSLLDIPAIFACLPAQCRIIAKKELFYIPILGWNLWAAGHFPVDRSNPRRTARSLKRVIEGVRAGKSLLVFPEGTRSEDGRLRDFKAGAFKIAVRAGVPIVPVSICGTHELLPKGSLAPRPGHIDVVIGEPIDTRLYSEQRLAELMNATRCAIAEALEKAGQQRSNEASLTVQSAGR